VAVKFVDDAWCQEPRETACEAEEEKLVGMVPTHVQLQRDFASPKGGERPAAPTPQRGLASWQRQRNAARCRLLVSRWNPRAGLVTSRQLFVRRCHGVPELRSDLGQRGRITVLEAGPEVGPQHHASPLAKSAYGLPNSLPLARQPES
jgi:hypothetical protein